MCDLLTSQIIVSCRPIIGSAKVSPISSLPVRLLGRHLEPDLPTMSVYKKVSPTQQLAD